MMTTILPLWNKNSGCDYHRIMLPLEEMGYSFGPKDAEELNKVRIVTYNRLPQRIDLVKKVLQLGIKTIMDLDDYWVLYPEHPMAPWWKKVNMSYMLEHELGSADVITCTTPRLADKIRPINPNVHVIPNAIPFRGQFLRKEADYTQEGIRFGYVGGSSHLADIKRIAGVFNHFPTLDFTLFGYTPMPAGINKPNVWDKMEAVCNFNGHNPNFKLVGSKPFKTYMEHYDQIDVAIAPLAENHFNQYKSSLKFYEAAAKKCAFICSDMPPYSDDIPRDIAFFCKTNKDWVNTIKYLIKNPDVAKAHGQAGYDWVYTHRNLNDVNNLRTDLYASLLK
jgi:hypothetical protein